MFVPVDTIVLRCRVFFPKLVHATLSSQAEGYYSTSSLANGVALPSRSHCCPSRCSYRQTSQYLWWSLNYRNCRIFRDDAYMQDMDMLPLDDSLEFSGDMKDLRCHRERLPDFQDQIDLDGDYNIMDNSSSDMKKHFQDIEDNKKYLWDATSRFSDEDLLCERSCEASWKNWPCKQGGTSVKFSNSDEQLILDDTFERPQKRNKRKLLCLGALTNRLALSR